MQRAATFVPIAILTATAAYLSWAAPEAAPAASKEKSPAAEPVKPATAPETPPHTRPWPQDGSDIKPDSKTVFGSLPNGMRYIIYPNAEPPGRVSLRLHIAAGSLMEADDQQGLAHFLEHMVFNGTRNYKADELVPMMQRLGIAFGAHANAYTSFDETVYQLDLPKLDEDTLNLGFTVMRDFGDGALLDENEIDKERGVVISEMVSRDSVDYRMMKQQFQAMLPDSRITHRFPIGEESVLKSAPRERFADLYHRYYIPSRMTFVAVGDIKPEDMERRIEAAFGNMENPENPGTDPEMGTITPPDELECHVFTDAEVSSTQISLLFAHPYSPRPDSAADRITRLRLDIAHAIMDRRFERIAKKEASPITEGQAIRYDLFNHVEIGSIGVTAANDDWQQALPVVEIELRRALEFGFTDAEFAEAKANILNAYEQAVRQKDTRKSETIANSLASSTHEGKVFSSPETNLQIVTDALATLDAGSCHQAFSDFWKSTGCHLALTTKKAPENAPAQMAKLYQDSRDTPVAPPDAREAKPFAYTDFGAPGKVAESKEIKDLGITQLVLANDVRVNLKPTDYEKGRIHVLVRFGSGQLTQPADKPMFSDFADAIVNGGGLGQHSNDELREVLAGKNVSSSFAIGEDAFTFSGSTNPADFLLECQLLCASLTDPGWRDEALWQFQKSIPVIEQEHKHTPSGPAKHMDAWLHNHDARYSPADSKQLTSYTINEVKQWLAPEFAKSSMEVSIVGDFKADDILPAILSTFGALPARNSSPADHDAARKIPFPKAPAEKTFTYETKIPQGIAIRIWQTDGLRHNTREFRRLNILATILSDRLREKIREELGASYGPSAGADGSDALDNHGYIAAQCVGKPIDMKVLQSTMDQLAISLAKDGATKDEFERAISPTLTMLEKSKRDNNYWLSLVLNNSQADPERLNLARTRDADYRSITLEDINTLAKKYLGPQRSLSITIAPQ